MVQKDTMSMSMLMTPPVPIPTPTASISVTGNTSTPHNILTSLPAPTVTSSLPLAPTSTSTSTAPISTKASPTSTSAVSTFTSSTTTAPISTSATLPTTTLPPFTSIPTSTILTTSSSATPSPPSNTTLTATHSPPTNHTAAIVGISVGSSIALILLLSILITWYCHIRSRNNARREEELEVATNTQGTFIGGFKLAQLKASGEDQTEKEVADLKGLRRSNTREDGRRNGIVLHSIDQLPPHPTPSETQLHTPSPQAPNPASQEGGQLARARFDAWKRARGLPTADELYQLQTHSQAELRTQKERKEENIEITATGVKRARTTIDAWKTGEVPARRVSIPEVVVTAATPVVKDGEFGGNGGKKGKGPATFEDMGLKRKGKGLGVDLKEMEGVLAPPRTGKDEEQAWWEKK